jgi:cold shock CspA family protein
MRNQGTLSKWNEAQGSGFISPGDGEADVYVHMSSMPRDGMRPRLGENLSYEVELDPGGKPRAMRVWRLGDRASVAEASRKRREGNARTKNVAAAVIAALVAYVIWMGLR